MVKKEDVPKLLEKITEEKEKATEIIDKEMLKLLAAPREHEDPMVAIWRMQFMRDIVERQRKGEEIDFNKVITFMTIKTALQPQQSIDPNLLLALTKSPEGGQWSQFIQTYLQQQTTMQQQNLQMQQNLLTMLFGQKTQIQEIQTQQILDSLNQAIANQEKRIEDLKSIIEKGAAPAPDLITQLENEIRKKETLEKFAETFKPKEIMKEGKFDWGAFAERAIGIIEKGIEAAAKRPEKPPIQEVKEIPIEVKAEEKEKEKSETQVQIVK